MEKLPDVPQERIDIVFAAANAYMKGLITSDQWEQVIDNGVPLSEFLKNQPVEF